MLEVARIISGAKFQNRTEEDSRYLLRCCVHLFWDFGQTQGPLGSYFELVNLTEQRMTYHSYVGEVNAT